MALAALLLSGIDEPLAEPLPAGLRANPEYVASVSDLARRRGAPDGDRAVGTLGRARARSNDPTSVPRQRRRRVSASVVEGLVAEALHGGQGGDGFGLHRR